MTAEQLRPIFEKKYNRSEWYDVLKGNFNVTTLFEKPVDITHRVKSNPYNAKAWELGSFNTLDGHLVGMYEVEVKERSDITRNRKGLRNLLSQVYSIDVEAALLVFIQGNKWRFSYVSEITVKNKETGKREKKTTDPKRYTYLLGEGERAKTAADRFARTKKSEDLFGGGVTLHALEEAFNVEKMSKAFFNEYRKQYGQFTAHITGEDENSKKIKNASPFLKSTFNGDHKEARDFVKKMMGRIVFLYFLEKKGWLGVPPDGAWGEGDENFLSNLFNHSKEKKAFYSNVLVHLFFSTLNTERKEDNFKIDDKLFTKAGYSKLKIPYLNGGLFEEDETMTQFLVFPEELFANLFTFFDQYNFTVYEDSPDEHTVAVDPEMLGHIFENLLEDNKDKGAFYTPKEIVHYMCRESLIEYLYTKLNPQPTESYTELGKQQAALFGNADKKGQLSLEQKNNTATELVARSAIEKLVLQHEAADIIEYDEGILKALKEVKICDPAIGSGAFPMGLLMEIFHLVETLYYASPDVTADVWKFKKGWEPAKVKEEIIQNSIYGVDIEKGAVDIARLRFWLSLVVEEDTPKPLPNLDYKIVVGNSLLSKFEEEVIDIDWDIKNKNASAVKDIINEQQVKLHLLQSRQHLYFVAKGDKAKLQKEIRDLKIDVLVKQLMLSRIQYDEANKLQQSAFPTEKEKKKAEEVTEKIRDYNRTIHKLEAIKRHKTELLHFFDWKIDFPEVMNEKISKNESGFDIVIGNPPYLRIQGMRESDFKLADELTKRYKSATGSFDLYVTFLEKGLSLVKANGIVNYIMPVKWTNAAFGSGLRQIVSENKSVYKIINFGAHQVFNASTYTGLQWFKQNSESLSYFELGQDLDSTQELGSYLDSLINASGVKIGYEKLTKSNWVLAIGKTSEILNKLNLQTRRISDVFEKIFQGLATSKDDVYFLYDCAIKGKYVVGLSKQINASVKIEKNFTKPLLKEEDVHRYEDIKTDRVVIFPYKLTGDTAELYKEEEIKEMFPNAYSYLKQCETILRDREKGRFNIDGEWFQFGRKQGINSAEQEKLLAPEISLGGNFVHDEKGRFYSTTTIYGYIKKQVLRKVINV